MLFIFLVILDGGMIGSFLIMSRIYVGNLDPRVSERELEDEFRTYGVIRRYGFTLPVPNLLF